MSSSFVQALIREVAMLNPFRAMHLICILTIVVLVHPVGTARAETLIGRNIDSRCMLGFTASAERVEGLLPSGWKVIGFPSGPLKGTNLLLGLEDRHLGMTADGTPALLALAKGVEGVRLFVLRVFSSDKEYNLFPDGVPSEVARGSTSKPIAGQGQRQQEEWAFAPENGGLLEVSFEFGVGIGAWVSADAKTFSSSNPEIARIFRYDQLVNLVMSKAAGKPLDGTFSMAATIPELSEIFDGSEELVGLMNIPVYIREVFEP